MALTDAVARQARITAKAYTLNDSDGLSLFVTANGAKKWHFRFSLQCKQQRDELRAQLAGGGDPRIYRQ
ncbi:Arm DNA-binding domain-containing protein [Pectobacterium actinidiae]|uniref:Arm DNA-binding domain-containing protein n=1 Tax=Pectobacterium actinidiae TaxID=1507808 RepID=A0ABW8GGD6_9GAMM|nr:Arm DNA-binding domain-containing protein [Pectobacterium actinidiae]MDY4317372.1 Arm DNA-binding domain-containing protein [Pectobacterium actinidiae]